MKNEYSGNATLNSIVEQETNKYLASIDVNNPQLPKEIEATLVNRVQKECKNVNGIRKQETLSTGDDNPDYGLPLLRPQGKLCASQIASIMLKMFHIVRVKCGGENADPSYDLLAIYQEDGIDKGTYVTDESVFKRYAKKYNYSITSRELDDVMEFLLLDAPRVCRTLDRDLVAVNNGIFNFKTKKLKPFSPNMVFMTKSHVDYNPNAENPLIFNPEDDTYWDVESWMESLSDDSEIVILLWEILSAIIRPHVRWNKSAWLYSTTGNNGKGTLCELMRNLVGSGSYAAIPLSDFSKDFALEPLTRSTAIIVDENDVGVFVDKAANLKAVITNDVIPINRKFKTPISYQFYGFMVQCLNEFPRFKDKSDSFYRRQLFIPFDKCFTGSERKYIKEDYLHRREVLEYVLHRVLHMDFYTLSEPKACVDTLNEFKECNDPVRQFYYELEDRFVWDLLPFDFLYELYKCWFRKNSPTGSMQGKQTFISEIIDIANSGDKWFCEGRGKLIKRVKGGKDKMSCPEHLIAEYDVVDWQNPVYFGHDIDSICSPKLFDHYRGLVRRVHNLI